MLKKIFVVDWHYKLVSVLLATVVWFFVSYGVRTPLYVEKEIQIVHQDANYTYKLSKKKARVKLFVLEITNIEEVVEDVKVYVDVKGLSEGEYMLKVNAESPNPFLAIPTEVEPSSVRVYVKRRG
ncbi:hypothetical protein [Thermocrinis minervae]|uniref:YbbR-like protein n=1 Tax=Thermocrinis minervae TaxID=381751 RepID=A0A1M6R106_9AQUI|nr:hypothetical protein [Thermocrinis minervae]SHK26152.1 hypothetical protein SAMN05444391_0476 [Thermocrinis minervae]